MPDIVIDQAPKTRLAPPSKRWRNVYWLAKRISLNGGLAHDAGAYGPGRFVSRRVWPSREIAEAKGMWSVEHAREREHITYLGPEEA